MDKAIKITSLEAENVKRIRAVKVEPTAAGLAIIGGDNTRERPRCWTRSHGRWEGIVTVK